jgi:hypothetical protein
MTAPNVGALRAMLLVLVSLAGACDDNDADVLPCACTEEFRSYHLTVLDAAGNPADGVEVTVVREDTGEQLEFGAPAGSAGTYVIMDDSFSDRIGPEEAFDVSGARDEDSFRADFRFGTDPCRCHVLFLAGPDSVTLTL